MDIKGVVIEKVSISWLQLLSVAFVIGGFVYTTASTFNAVQTMKSDYESHSDTYIPIVNQLVRDSKNQAKTYEKLDITLTELTNSIIAMTAIRSIEADQLNEIKSDIKDLQERTTNLEILVGKR